MPVDIAYGNLNTIAASVGPKYVEEKIEDIFFDAHPFFDMIKTNGNIKKNKGTGKSLVLNLRVGANSTVGNRSTRDIVPLQAQETNTTAEWPWGSITGSLVFDDQDLHDNMGKQDLVDILETAIDQLVDSWVDVFNLNLVQQGSYTSSFQFLGLQDGVSNGSGEYIAGVWTADSQLHPASYGGLTPAQNQPLQNWCAHVKASSGTQAALVDDLNNVFNRASYGTIKRQPDLIMTDQRGEEIYRSLMDTNIRYTDTKSGDGTINAVTFRGKPVVFDRELTPMTSSPAAAAGQTSGLTWSGSNDTANTHRYYVLNTRFWEFHFDSQWNLDNSIEKQWRIPFQEFKRSKLVALRGQLITRQRRYNSLLLNVPD